MRSLAKAFKIREESIYGYLFILPFFIIFVLFVITPIYEEILLSFQEAKLGGTPVFVGLKNFRKLLASPDYLQVLFNMLLFVGIGVNAKMVLGLFIAMFLNKEFKGKSIVEVIFLLPWAVPTISALLGFKWIFDTDLGIANKLLSFLGFSKIMWLTTYETAMLLAIIFHIWKWVPFWTIILLSGLKSIPVHLYEASEIDGANKWQIFRFITLPLIKNLYIMCTLLSTIWTMGDFIIIYVLTGGGPAQTTNVLATIAYRYAFIIGDFGISSASIVFVLPLVIVLALLLIKKVE